MIFAGFQVPDKLSQMVRYGAMLRLPFDYACFDYAQHEQHKPDAPNAPYTTTGKGLLMPDLRFEWDTGKAQTNLKKHGVSFEEARSVFYDEDALQFYDPDHSADEDRFIMLTPCATYSGVPNRSAEKLAPCAKLRLGTPRMRGFSFIEIKLHMASCWV